MKILLLHSPSTKGGTERILDFLEPEISVDFAAHRPGNMAKYDGVILHNFIDAKPGEPTAIYPCGSPTRRMINKPEYREQVLATKPLAIWTYNHTSNQRLTDLVEGRVRVRYMPKPFPLVIPDKCPPMPEERRILWYWRKDWMHTENLDEQIKRLMKQVADAGVEIWVVSNKRNLVQHEPIKHPNVIPTGRVDIPKMAHMFSGMVRVTEPMDYGRSTYQVMAYGRWCMYVGVDEPHVISAQSADRVPDLVQAFVSQKDGWEAEVRREYIANNFSDEALKKHWQKEVMEIFKG